MASFLVGFSLILVALLLFSTTAWFAAHVLAPWLRFNAEASAALLRGCGLAVEAKGHWIVSDEFSLEVRRGCDAYTPWALFLATVLAFPAPWGPRLAGILAGSLLLGFVNCLRLASLHLIGERWPEAFDRFHVDVWQPLFIALSVCLFLAWVGLARRKRTESAVVDARPP